MKSLRVLLFLLLSWAAAMSAAAEQPSTDAAFAPATPAKLPRWRGFNLTNKFQLQWNNGPFLEEDFRMIRELGFNFVRLPMDYRVWTEPGDWTRFRESVLAEIDQAVAWGGKYGIHVMINFHRAPGYTVADPPESKVLWTDEEAQRVCALHWATFARRYRGIPSARLSFNLFNEPANIDPAVHAAVVRKMLTAIHREDPERLVVCDGLPWGQRPSLELAGLVAQATRGYTPMDVTHYQANWIVGADQYPLPAWPRLAAYGTLYMSSKPGMSEGSTAPLVIEGPFPQAATIRVHVDLVSSRARLVAKADGRTAWQKEFVCGPGSGEWKRSELLPQWKSYQCTYDRDYEFPVPAGARRLELAVTQGDWLRLTELAIRGATRREDVLPLRADWDRPPARVRYAPGDPGGPFLGENMEDRRWLWETAIVPWKEAEARGIGVMVGEFGAFNATPHAVTLAWMEDCLANWQAAGWGWALWNFRGSFGILDSQRRDVTYEDYHGHKLDRKMLELLQRY